MVSIPERTRRRQRGRTARGGVAAARSASEASVPELRAMRVRAAQARARIREQAAAVAPEPRRVLRGLARALHDGRSKAARVTAAEASVAACLDAVAAGTFGDDRWAACEAAAWAIAWLARVRRAGGSAGRLLERLVGEARAACAALAARDTRPARFVVVIARLFADVEACQRFEGPVREALTGEIVRLVSAEGAVGLSGSRAAVERVARWTAAREAAIATGGLPWDDDTERRWLAAACGAVRLLGTRGRVPGDGSGRSAGGTGPALLATLAQKRRPRAPRALRRTAQLVAAGTRRGAAGHSGLLPPDLHDPAAAATVIRTGWDAAAVRVSIEYRDAVPRLEIAAGERLLVEGPWRWAIEADGSALEAEGAWTVSCWESDHKAAFLEIAALLSGGLRIERHVAVLRRERIVLIADAIAPAEPCVHGVDGPPAPALDYRGHLPLAGALETEPAAETREVIVFDTAMRCMVLPLALNEWRVAGAGEFGPADGGLALSQPGRARLYAPLWLDCDVARVGGPLTWRQLTVADTRRNLPPHQAAGFRVQAGQDQWLLYRTLDACRNRTLLGCNVSSGFLLGRLKRSGEVARTLEIE